MLGIGGANRWGWQYSLTTAPTVTPGVSVTPGNGSKGSYVQLASGANLSQDVYLLWLMIGIGSTSNTARPVRIDIGLDPAGGTTYTVKLADILCGQSATYATGLGYRYLFPLYIEAGTSVGVCGQATETGTFRVWGKFFGRPSEPDRIRAGQWAETVGTPSGAAGVSLTSGSSGSEGSWVSLGTTVRRCWHWQLSAQINNGTITALAYFVDLAWGDATNKTMIQENVMLFAPGTAETLGYWCADVPGFADVPAGATLYARATCSGTAVTGLTALAHGIGG
jgi:hypothetical protein